MTDTNLPNAPVREDTPLAFVGANPQEQPIQTVPPEIANPTVTPTQAPQPSTIPTPTTDPSPMYQPTNTQSQPKKKKLGMVVGGVLAFLFLVIGGTFAYQYLTSGEIPLIAGVLDDYNYQHPDRPIDTNADGSDARGNRREREEDLEAARQEGARMAAEAEAARIAGENAAAAAKAEADRIATEKANSADKKTMNDYVPSAGTDTTNAMTAYNNSLQKSAADIAAHNAYNDYIDGCTSNRAFAPTDECIQAAHAAAATAYGVAYGDDCKAGDSGCPTACNSLNTSQASSYKYDTQEPGGGQYCDDQGRLCKLYRKEKMTTAVPGADTMWCFMGYGEQCGQAGSCDEETTTKTTSTTPTMSCTGITKSPSAPALGGVVTLTCTGTVTPSTAGTLSYKFRYSVNGGSYSTLTNKTATTAELTIAACGTYSVQCQACATLNGVLTCDPTWTGATTN